MTLTLLIPSIDPQHPGVLSLHPIHRHAGRAGDPGDVGGEGLRYTREDGIAETDAFNQHQQTLN